MNSEQLKLLIKEGEGLRVEFKESYSSKLNKDLVAFANTKGGYLLIGVDDSGNVVGAKLTNKLKAEINGLARNCEPAITLQDISQIDKVIVIEIAEGEEKPYSCSNGYFRRLDGATQKMSQHELKILFRENDKRPSFEEEIYEEATFDDISDNKITRFFEKAKISIPDINPKNFLTSLNLAVDDAIKNAGILFFANEPRRKIFHCETILAAFKGTNRVDIYDRRDIQDDLLTQYEEAIIFLKKHLNIRSEIKDTIRSDIYEIPIDALREAVVNAIIHRDYNIRGTSIMVEVHEDRVVISNPGGIPAGMDIKDLMKGVSKRRNELIADIFARVHVAERMGSGLKRIARLLKDADQPLPKIDSNLFFKITFKRPFFSEGSEKSSEKGSEKTVMSSDKASYKGSDKKLDKTAKIILEEIAKDPFITAKQLSELLSISLRAIEKQLARLKTDGHIERIGSDKSGHWQIND